MRLRHFGLSFVAGLSLLSASVALAGTQGDLSTLSPQHQVQFVKEQAARRAGISHQYNYDIRPAVLKHVAVGGQVKANLKGAQAVVSLKMADNMTGVSDVSVYLTSPSGNQYASGYWDARYERTREDLVMGVDMSSVSENGTWRVRSVTVRDANGNASNYDEAALATMGKPSFEVIGAVGDFEEPAAMAGGVNLTPSVSRSTPPRGMLPGADPRVGIQLKLADAGASGIRSASMNFCKVGGGSCLYLSGEVSVRGTAETALTLGGTVSDWVDVGSYLPYSLYLYDFAGNYRSYYGNELIGLLDAPAIEVTE